ncbi:hypothetical protein WMF27_20655 [Sorangium sp. So ce281]|uniref:hypothetical protein n=1 Tax=unclassified Sorangium TaxID=2621164 RepID=UPI003F630EF9
MTRKIEQLRAAALLAALTAEAEGPNLAGRVRRLQEEILAARERGKWVDIDPEVLRELIAKLDGPASASRHLGISKTALYRWAANGRVKRWAFERMKELIASGAKSMRRPQLTRHYRRGSDDEL